MDNQNYFSLWMSLLCEFIDDHTRKVWVFFMKHKSEVFSHFKAFKAMVENEKSMQIKVLKSNGGGEYLSEEFKDYLKE